MRGFTPFEPAPTVAVAVSGGPDSLALALLLNDWATARGGRVLALTVDHGLRPDSAAEARWVGETLAAHGIEHRILPWQGPKPDKVRQQHAREERYDRLRAACAEAGVLHLALGHHRDDRAETVLLRVRGGSGVDGLAGMAQQREMPELRLIRPLLDRPKAALRATCDAYGVGWVDDPTNRNPDHLRVRLRQTLPALAAEGITVGGVNVFAGAIGQARRYLEAAQNNALAYAVMLHPAGFGRLDPAALSGLPQRVARGVLARALLAVGGQIYPPRGAALDRLLEEVLAGLPATRTLGGCQLVPRRGRVLLVREWETVSPLPIGPGETLVFDGRFEVEVAADAPDGLRLAPIGRAGWAELTQTWPALRDSPLPPPVRPALTGLFDGDGLACVPALSQPVGRGRGWLAQVRYAPRRALTGAAFTVAQDAVEII